MRIRTFGISSGLALLVGCATPYGATVDPTHVVMTVPANGQMQVSGLTGCVGGASTVQVNVKRQSPAQWRVLHAGHYGSPGALIASGSTPVLPDGSFAAVSLGTPDNPVRTSDFVDVIPQSGGVQAGLIANLTAP